MSRPRRADKRQAGSVSGPSKTADEGRDKVISEQGRKNGRKAAGPNVEPEEIRAFGTGNRGNPKAQPAGFESARDLPDRGDEQADADQGKDEISAGLRVYGVNLPSGYRSGS